MMKRASAALLASLMLGGPALAADPITGAWVTEDKDAVVRIGKCGASLCGEIARYLVTPPDGVGQKDINNPNKKLRSRTLLGSNVLYGFKADGDVWRGRIYDPKSGKNYRSVVERVSSGVLKVEGCVGPFCQSQRWTRAK